MTQHIQSKISANTKSDWRPFKVAGTLCSLVAAIALATHAIAADAEKPKPASEATKAANNALLKELPFNDKTSFELAHKGFIAPLPSTVIKGASGNVIWDPTKRFYQGRRGSTGHDQPQSLAAVTVDQHLRLVRGD
jgi:alkyl sulfatase BDS1-like metallo-beta-lactamase superfamily hydrolase